MRKGSLIDFFWVVAVLMTMTIMLFLGIYLKDQIFPELTTAFGAGEATNTVNTVSAEYVMFDYIFLFIFIFFFTLPIILAAILPSHPILYIINILILIIFFAVVPALSNVVREFISQSEFAQYAAGGTAAQTYPIMTRLMEYLPVISICCGILLIIVMAIRPKDINL